MSEFHTDSLRPSSLPTASLGRRQPSAANADKDADAELDKVAEDWNLRIDKEMKNLTGGLGELVELADVRLLSSFFLFSSSSPALHRTKTLLLHLLVSGLLHVVMRIRIAEKKRS
jgi:hypothetical protein